MKDLIAFLHELNSLLPMLLPILLVLFNKWVKNDEYRKAISNAVTIASIYVAEADKIVRERKSPDTESAWTEADAAAVRAKVLEKMRAALQKEIPVIAERLDKAQSLDGFLTSLVEAEVTRLKRATPLPPPTTTPAAPGSP